MNHDSDVQTPTKNNSIPVMVFIKTPNQQKDIYDELIQGSAVQFPILQSRSFQQEQQQSSNFQDSEEESEEDQEEEYIKEQKVQENNIVPQCQHKTPEKRVKMSKGCNCKNSHCLKKYCDCFKVGEICSDECRCLGCKNNHLTITHKNLQKIAEMTRSGTGGKKLRCKCQKSHCLNGYCECHNAGQKCSQACICIQCDNQIDSLNGTKGKKRRHVISEWSSNSNILFN